MRLQDAYQCFSVATGSHPIVVVVSDGAGSASHGGEGASLVVRTIAQRVRRHFDASPDVPAASALESWVDEARDLIAAVASRRQLTSRDFAATLLCVISDGNHTLLGHIGDGCAVLKTQHEGSWIAPIWPDAGEYASTTYFVTDEDGPRLRLAQHIGAVAALAVFSDGIERLALDFANRQPYEKFFSGMTAPIAKSVAIGNDRDLSMKLKTYLGSAAVNARTDDDKTLVLVVRK